MLSAALLLIVQVQSQAVPSIPTDSYSDSATADLVRRARSARERNERLVSAYDVRVSSRLGVGIRALARDRMLYRQEVVADIHWRRDSITTVEVIGAREGVPIAIKGDQIPDGLDGEIRDLVIDPGSDYLRLMSGDDDGFVYPLRDGAENDYRFQRGGVTTFTLGTGTRIELVALKVIPRRADFQLISGTLWFDNSTANLVRIVFRPARPFEMRRDLDPDDLNDTPSWVNAGAEIKYITVEYGLFENRWWLPRYIGIDAKGTVGSWLNAPFRMERVYEDYEVTGGTAPDSNSNFVPAGRRWIRSDHIDEDGELPDSIQSRIDDCIREESARIDSSDQRITTGRRIRNCTRYGPKADSNLSISLPEDTLDLLVSPELGEPILNMGDLVNEDEILALKDALGALPERPWEARLMLPGGTAALLQHARYNRVEGLSLGLSGGVDFGRLQLTALGRLGIADLEPNGEFTLVRPTLTQRYTLGAYRRLAPANPAANPLGSINSFRSLFAGSDDGMYFRSTGVELGGQNVESGWWSARVFAERQESAVTETDFSIPNVFDSSHRFRQNITANEVDQFGAELSLRGRWYVSPSVTLGIETTLDGEAGDAEFGRGTATARMYYTRGGPVAAAFTFSAGTSVGSPTVQRLFYLGGPSSLRGYDGGVTAGTGYWYGRAEVGNSFPAARLIGFTDIGWAGDRDNWGSGRTLIGVGVGGSVMDGLVRLDLSRAVRAPTGWRLDFYIDGAI
jgi:hypothetical protein